MIRSNEPVALAGGCIAALGTFDGVHLGHRRVLADAAGAGLPVAVVTFAQHPQSVLGGPTKQRLFSPERCDALFEKLGIAAVVRLDFAAIRDMSPDAFLAMLVGRMGAKGFACGYNFRFGRGAEGDAAALAAYCKKRELFCSVSEPVSAGGGIVSSSRIREAVAAGEMEIAAQMLGAPYCIEGPVEHGDARGRLLGFPTVNQALEEGCVLPRFGVYAARVNLNGKEYPAVTNVGVRPTFGAPRPLAESHVIGFEGDLYGEGVAVALKRFLREERKFDSSEALIAQMRADAEQAAK